MINGKRIVVIMPAYNAESTLAKTYREISFDLVDDVILTDDSSTDRTTEVAQELGIEHIIVHPQNKGYGANQKSCYDRAMELRADIIVMVHPDYQYTPKLIPSMAYLIANDIYDVVLGSRILGKGALEGGMPLYKYIANRFLTFFQNILINQKLSEYHTGYRCFKVDVLKSIPFHHNSDNFIFDNQLLAQICHKKWRIGEVSCPTKYFAEASSINFKRSVIYGLGVIWVSITYFLHRNTPIKFKLFNF